MDQETLFREQLASLVKTARRQGMYVSKEQVAEQFPDLAGAEEKLAYIYDYLKGVHIAVGEASGEDAVLTEEEKDFFGQYLESIAQNATVTEEEKKAILLSATAGSEDAKKRLIEIYLPNVAELAKLYTGQGVYIEDLIGEGNVALMMAVDMLECNDDAKEADAFVANLIMDAMEQLIDGTHEAEETDQKVLDMVNQIALAAKELAEEYRRKVSVSELASEGKFTEDEIREALRVTANSIEDIEA